MPRNAVTCNMCGGQFFPASLPFHQKSCAKKIASQAKAAGLPNPLLNMQAPTSARSQSSGGRAPSARRPGSAASSGSSLPPVDFNSMNTRALRSFLDKRGVSHAGCVEKALLPGLCAPLWCAADPRLISLSCWSYVRSFQHHSARGCTSTHALHKPSPYCCCFPALR